MRVDGRQPDELRQVQIQRHYTKFAPGSVLIEFGETKVLCTACIEENVPPFLMNSGKGWVTAEYSMLPGSTQNRKPREARRGQIEGRTQEIQRFIGRALRSVVDLKSMGERTIWVDCDVIQADGGTRTTAINGAYIALVDCFRHLMAQRNLKKTPLTGTVAAISLGVVGKDVLTDLCYVEDSKAEVDMNVVMNDKGEYIEIQGVAEGVAFGDDALQQILAGARTSIQQIMEIQERSLREI